MLPPRCRAAFYTRRRCSTPSSSGFPRAKRWRWTHSASILLGLEAGRLAADKVAALALLTTGGAVLSMVVQPIAGALSDRTRGRFGRRVPWVLGGSVLAGACLCGVGTAAGLWELAAAWMLFQLVFNVVPGQLHAMVPDRVPRPLLGTFAAVYGAASMAGGIFGTVYAWAFAGSMTLAWSLLGAVLVLGAVLLAAFVGKDPEPIDSPAPFRWRTFAAAYWVNPLHHPDFAWTFGGRFLMNLGYDATTTYLLYVLQDYAGLGDRAVDQVPLVGGASLLGMVVTTILSGPLSDRLGRRKIFVTVAGVVVGAAAIVPLVSPTLPAIIVFVFCSGLGFGVYQAVDLAIVVEVLPSRAGAGAGMGVLNLAVALPATLAPVLGSWLVHASGTYAPIFVLTLVASLASSFAVTRVRSVR